MKNPWIDIVELFTRLWNRIESNGMHFEYVHSLHMFSIEHWCGLVVLIRITHYTLCARDPMLTKQPMPCHVIVWPGLAWHVWILQNGTIFISFSDEMKWNEMLQSCSTFDFQLISIMQTFDYFVSFSFSITFLVCIGYFHFNNINCYDF